MEWVGTHHTYSADAQRAAARRLAADAWQSMNDILSATELRAAEEAKKSPACQSAYAALVAHRRACPTWRAKRAEEVKEII